MPYPASSRKVVLSTILYIVLVVGCLQFLASKSQAATGINKQINFQGKVVNSNGTNVTNGSYTFVFSLYSASSGGSPIWTETKSLTVTDGVFRTSLGDTTTLPGSVDFNTDNIYLGVEFNSDGEMTPRVRFTAVPYAFNALKVAGLTVTDTTGTFTLANGKTLTVNNTLTFSGTDSTTFTLPSSNDTIAGIAATQTLTNKTLTAPKFADLGYIADPNGNELLIFDSVASAVNEITLANAATGNGVSLAATGGDTNVALSITTKATGALTLDSGTTGIVNVGTGNNAKTINLGTGTGGNTINIGTNNTVTDSINIGSALDGVAITGSGWSVTSGGALTVSSCTGCGGGGGANTALSNLSAVAINTSLLPGTDDTIDLGDNTHRFRDAYLGGETLHIGTSTTDEGVLSYTTSSNTLLLDNVGSAGAINFGNGTTNPTYLFNGSGSFGTSTGSVSLNGATTVANAKNFVAGQTTGKIGFGGAVSGSDYLLSMTLDSTQDWSRGIDITQANDSAEDSTVFNIANTVNHPGTVTSGTRTMSNGAWTLTPTVTFAPNSGSAETLNLYGLTQTLSLGGLTISDSSGLGQPTVNAYANSATLSGSPSIADTTASMAQVINFAGYAASVALSPNYQNLNFQSETINIYGGQFSNTSTKSGTTAVGILNTYGISATATGNLTTSGSTTHYGGYFSAGGTADNNYGLYVANTTGATTSNVGLYIADAGTYSLQLASTDGDAASGITFGTDTNLYRSAANVLQTDDQLRTIGASTSSIGYSSFVTADTFARFYIQTDGQLYWGDGSGAQDTTLYRSAANTLRTDDAFNVNGTFNVTTAGVLSGITGYTQSSGTHNVTAADGSLFDFSSVNTSSTSEGIKLPQATSCASGTANGQICWDNDTFVLYVGNGTTAQSIGGGISGSGASGQMTYWNGTSSVTGSTKYLFDPTATTGTGSSSELYLDANSITSGNGLYISATGLTANGIAQYINAQTSSTTGTVMGSINVVTVANSAESFATYIGSRGHIYISSSAAISGYVEGLEGIGENANTQTISNLRGVTGYSKQSAAGIVTLGQGIYGQIQNSSGTFTSAAALYAANPSAAGTITSAYGIYVEDQTKGGSDYGIAIAGADTQVLWLSSGADNTDAANGIAFGASRDTDLYRSAADTLKTDDAFNINGNLNFSSAGAITGSTGYTQSSGAFAFSGGGNFSVDSAAFDVTTGGVISGVTGYTQAAGSFNLTPDSTNDINLTVSNAGTRFLNIAGLATGTAANGLCQDSSGNVITCTVGTATAAGTSGQIAFFNGAASLISETSGFGWDTTNKLFTVAGSTSQSTQTIAAITGTSNSYTTGKVLNVDLTQTAATGTSVSGNIASITFNPTYSTAITTPAISGSLLNVARASVTNSSFASTLTVSGAVAALSSNCTQTTGTCTDTGKILTLTQSYASATGAVLGISNSGSGADILGTSSTWSISKVGAISAATSTNTINNLIINSGALSGVTGYTQSSGTFSLTAADSSIINLSAVNVSGTGEGFISPQATSCASGTANGQLCWDNDTFALYVGNGSSAQLIGGVGGITGSGTNNTISKFTGTGTIGNSLLTDNATTLTYTGTGGLSLSGASAPITLSNSETIDNATNGQIMLGRNDAGTVTLSAKDNDANADFTITPGGTGVMEVGSSASVQTVLRTGTTDTIYFKDGANSVNWQFVGGKVIADYRDETSGTLYAASAGSAVTQTAAYIGHSIDLSTSVTVPNSAAGNQTGLLMTLKDGGASATSTGVSIAGTFDKGVLIAANATATAVGIDMGAMTGATSNTGINMTSFATATTSKGIVMGTNSSATAMGIDIGALSGGTANTGIKIGAISGAGTAVGIDIGAFTNTGASQYAINIAGFSGTHNGGTTASINMGNISSAGTTTTNYNLNMGTLTGGTTSNYHIQMGNITAIASATNAGIVIGTTKAVTGTAASSTNYGINMLPIDSTGTINTGINVGAVSGATTNYGIYITDASTASLVLASTGGTTASGILFGTDTNLFRSAADTLRTNDSFIAVLPAAGSLQVDASTTPNTVTANGALDLNVTSLTSDNRGFDINYTSTATSTATSYAENIAWSSSQVLGAANGATIYGSAISVTKTGADTSTGTFNQTGLNINVSNSGGTDTAAVKTFFGVNATTTGTTNAFTTAYGAKLTGVSADDNYGAYLTGSNGGTTAVNSITGVQGIASKTSTGTVTTAYGGNFQVINSNTNAITTGYGVFVTAPTLTAAITNNYGIRVGDMGHASNVTAAYGIRIDAQTASATSTYALNLAGTSGNARDGITFGTDTQLYRSAADTLTTGDTFTSGNTSLTSGTLADPGNSGTCTSVANNNSTTKATFIGSTVVTSSNIFNNTTRGKHARITSVATCVNGAAVTYTTMTLTDSVTSQVAGDSYVVYSTAASLGNSTSGFFNSAYVISYFGVTSSLSGGFDVAEQYETTDTSIDAGTLVSMDENKAEFITKSGPASNGKLLGVVSTQAALNLGDNSGDNWKKVALVGRVPVKVTTQNGPIHKGDFITSSSIAGVGMKATKAGIMVGQAMEDYDNADPAAVGRIMVFVNTGYVDPTFMIAPDGTLAGGSVNQNATLNSSDGKALPGLEIVTPKLTAQEVFAHHIVTDSIETKDATVSGTLKVDTLVANKIEGLDFEQVKKQEARIASLESLFATGSAVLGTETTATSSAKIQASDIDGLNEVVASLIQSQVKGIATDSGGMTVVPEGLLVYGPATMSDLTVTDAFRIGTNFVFGQNSLDVMGDNLEFQPLKQGGISFLGGIVTIDVDGTMTVGGKAMFNGETIFAGVTHFLNDTTFEKNVEFKKAPVFSSDTAGTVTVPAGKDRIEVAFSNEYPTAPVVNVSLDSHEDGVDEASASADMIFNQDYKFVVINKTSKGFTVLLNKKAEKDIVFSWMALLAQSKDKSATESAVLGTTDSSSTDTLLHSEGLQINQ